MFFFSENGSLGRTDILQHEIDTGDIPPIKLRPYRLPIFKRKEVDRQVDEMLKQGVISPSSPYSFPILLTERSDNAYRFCIDPKIK